VLFFAMHADAHYSIYAARRGLMSEAMPLERCREAAEVSPPFTKMSCREARREGACPPSREVMLDIEMRARAQ